MVCDPDCVACHITREVARSFARRTEEMFMRRNVIIITCEACEREIGHPANSTVATVDVGEYSHRWDDMCERCAGTLYNHIKSFINEVKPK